MTSFIPKFAELRLQAQERISEEAFEYIDDGADDEVTQQQNRECWRSIHIACRVLTEDVKNPDISCTLFGHSFSYPSDSPESVICFSGYKMTAPLMIAPMALHGLVHEDGECATARAAEKCGIPLVRITTGYPFSYGSGKRS